MIYTSITDFYEKANSFSRMSRQDEIECAVRMKNGDAKAREMIINSYLPVVAAHVRRVSPKLQTLGLVLYCQQALEKAVDTFDFVQNSETFTHRLSWWLRQATTKYIVK